MERVSFDEHRSSSLELQIGKLESNVPAARPTAAETGRR
jgi:hypothetical protein